jgi:hypothetical protein
MFAALLGRKRGTPVKVSVTLRLQSLSPFPATAKFKRMLVHWQRGDKKSGVTKAVLGAEDPSQRVAGGKGSHLKFDFRTLEAIEFTATLYKARLGERG